MRLGGPIPRTPLTGGGPLLGWGHTHPTHTFTLSPHSHTGLRSIHASLRSFIPAILDMHFHTRTNPILPGAPFPTAVLWRGLAPHFLSNLSTPSGCQSLLWGEDCPKPGHQPCMHQNGVPTRHLMLPQIGPLSPGLPPKVTGCGPKTNQGKSEECSAIPRSIRDSCSETLSSHSGKTRGSLRAH